MRGRLIAILTAGLLVLGIGAAAATNGGTEDGNNNVTCSGTRVNDGLTLSADGTGVMLCNDSGDVQGRIIVSSDGYVSIDGDRDNQSEAQGYIRLDANGATCGTGDSTYGQNGAPCQP